MQTHSVVRPLVVRSEADSARMQVKLSTLCPMHGPDAPDGDPAASSAWLLSTSATNADELVATATCAHDAGRSPCVELVSCRVRKYATRSVAAGNKKRGKTVYDMVLSNFSQESCRVLRNLLDALLNGINDKPKAWYPPRAFCEGKKEFNDPLNDDDKPILVIDGAMLWNSRTALSFETGALHDVQLSMWGVLVRQNEVNVLWKIVAMRPSHADPRQKQPSRRAGSPLVVRRNPSAAKPPPSDEDPLLLCYADSDDMASYLLHLDASRLDRLERLVKKFAGDVDTTRSSILNPSHWETTAQNVERLLLQDSSDLASALLAQVDHT